MVCTPVCANRRMSSSFVSSGIVLFSFCRPSRGPTSTILTWSAAVLLDVLKLLQSCLRRTGETRGTMSTGLFVGFLFSNTNSSENNFEEEEGQSTWTRLSVAHMFSWSRLCRGREAGNLECPAPRPATSSRNMEKCGECWLRCRLSSSFDIITSKNMYLSAKMRSLKSMRQYPARCMQI